MQLIDLYWPNGKKKRSIRFVDGLRSGLDEMWTDEGVLVDSGCYEKGEPVGKHMLFDEKGKAIEEINCSHEEKKDKSVEKTFTIEDATIPKCESKSSNLSERHPLLSLISRTWKVEKGELESLKPFNVGDADAIYIYGIGCGAPYFQLRKWLHENLNRKLIFVEEDEGNLAHFLTLPQSHFLINDTQVHLEWNRAGLAEKFPIQKLEIVAIPSKLGARFRKFKLDLLRKTTLSFALHQDRLHGYVPFKNFVQNVRYLKDSFYVNKLKNAFKGTPAIVCGAGPSLQEAIPYLKKLSNKALIIAGGSTLAALSSQGVPIHFGVAIDPNEEEYRRFKNSFAFNTPLIYSTRVHPGIFRTCNGPFGYMRSGIGGALELWIEEELNLREDLIGETLPIESIAVTPIATALAEFFGCHQIHFCGVDLAYTNGMRYASGVTNETKHCFLKSDKRTDDRIVRRKNYAGKYTKTATRWVMEAQSLSIFAKTHKKVQFFNTSKDGLVIKGVPYRPLRDLSLERKYDIPTLIEEKIEMMKGTTSQVIKEKMKELKNSLAKVIDCLEILSSKKKGSKALAEVELGEELAFDLLFYDVNEVLEQGNWKSFLNLANRYQQSLGDC